MKHLFTTTAMVLKLAKLLGIVGTGVLIGIYIDQNYEVPRVNKQSWDNLMKKMDDMKKDSKKDQS